MINRDLKTHMKKYAWYENPKYYLAITLIVLAFRLLIDVSHDLAPSIIMSVVMLSGSVLNSLFYLVLFATVLLLVRRGWQHA